MKKIILLIAVFINSLIAFGTIRTISATNSQIVFNPSAITIAPVDTVQFSLGSIHNAVEVSQATWNANGTTALSGGFSVSFGGGMVLPSQLTTGIHYFVCQAHASMGMKGTITVAGSLWTISANNTQLVFNPSNITITVGDYVQFVLGSIHNAVEVSQATWNANGTTALSGGFSVPFGGGMVTPANLPAGTHYFVCQAHASMGMKGIITVVGTSWTVSATNTQLAFTPSALTITLGDSVQFALGSIHNAVEVSQTTWNANGTTALAGGFSVAFGGGLVLPSHLPIGVHYYVCQAHASMGMKGTITVVPCVSLALQFFTQGYYAGGGMMTQVLYNENVENNPASTNVDTFTVELHSTVNTSIVVASFKGVVQTNGNLTCAFPCFTAGHSYYIAVSHRNTIETWSAAPVAFTSSTTYDFTTAANKAYANNMRQMQGGPWAFYTGDINQDTNIDLADFPDMDVGISSGYFGYYASDLNGDGNVDLIDFPTLELDISLGIFSQNP